MKFRGFLRESKDFVGYGPGMKKAFWIRFPVAAIKFYWLQLFGTK